MCFIQSSRPLQYRRIIIQRRRAMTRTRECASEDHHRAGDPHAALLRRTPRRYLTNCSAMVAGDSTRQIHKASAKSRFHASILGSIKQLAQGGSDGACWSTQNGEVLSALSAARVLRLRMMILPDRAEQVKCRKYWACTFKAATRSRRSPSSDRPSSSRPGSSSTQAISRLRSAFRFHACPTRRSCARACRTPSRRCPTPRT